MAYDAARGEVVLFGGATFATFFGDTWVWDGSNWTQKIPASTPPARVGHAMAYDAATDQVVLFGGLGNAGTALADTWVWDGSNWTQKTPSRSPPARSSSAMAYDAASGLVVLFGGNNDNNNGNPVFFGDTWVWDGSNWTQKTPAISPPARAYAAMAYDAIIGQLILFGGMDSPFTPTNLGDTWVWHGRNWIQKTPTNSPPARNGHAMAYDAARIQVVLFGGVSGGNIVGDTWVWQGNNWTLKTPASSPPARFMLAMAYDAASSQVVLFGGNYYSGGWIYYQDTWVWDASR